MNKFNAILIFCLFQVGTLSTTVHARIIQSLTGSETYCGIIKEFMGEVQLLRQDRTGFLETKNGSPIPCGSWLSVNEGWADIETKSKIILKVGSYSFLELYDFGENPKGKDLFTLYKGKVFVMARTGTPEAVLVSPHSRAKIKNGEALFIYDSFEEESQLVSMIGTQRIENKFKKDAFSDVRPGEMSQMNIKTLNITPTISKVVSVSSLRLALATINLTKVELDYALQAAVNRKEKNTVEIVGTKAPVKPTEEVPIVNQQRALASVPGEEYPSLEVDEKGEKAYYQKIVGGSPEGEKILFPNQVQGKSRNARVLVEDQKKKLGLNRKPAEEEEVQRLVKELSEIQVIH